MTSLEPGVLRPVNMGLYPQGLLSLRRSGTMLLSEPVLDPSRQQQCNLIAVFLQKRKMAVSSGTCIDQSGESNIHTCLPQKGYLAMVVQRMHTRLTHKIEHRHFRNIHQSVGRILLQDTREIREQSIRISSLSHCHFPQLSRLRHRRLKD